jgi:hypothetical protein
VSNVPQIRWADQWAARLEGRADFDVYALLDMKPATPDAYPQAYIEFGNDLIVSLIQTGERFEVMIGDKGSGEFIAPKIDHVYFDSVGKQGVIDDGHVADVLKAVADLNPFQDRAIASGALKLGKS